jgi:hypothetical protein
MTKAEEVYERLAKELGDNNILGKTTGRGFICSEGGNPYILFPDKSAIVFIKKIYTQEL